MVKSAVLRCIVAAPLLAGCYTTSVRSGLPPAGPPTMERDEAWHHGVALGMGELSGPYRMTELCPHGWAEIRTETSFVNGMAELITLHLYNPQTVTVICAAAPPGPLVTPEAGHPVPTPHASAPPGGMPPPPLPPPGPEPPPLSPGTP